MLTMNMGESELVAYPRERDHYVAQGGSLVMEGPWRIEAVIRRPGMEDVRPAFDIVVASISTGSTLSAAPVGQSALFVGVELLLVGFGALAVAVWMAPRRRRLLPIAVPAGIMAILAGSLVAGSGAAALSATVRNPIPPTVESIQVGREIYADRCSVCHGASGRGDGPAAVTLQPRPADFRTHLASGHTDAQLFDWLSNGFPGTAMPAFRSELTVDERWHVLNYIKTAFGPGRSQLGASASVP
jgi:mono/diheme cytochrome c family protein